MDAIDLRILRSLQSDAQQSVAELASHVGLSHTPCWRRLKKLEEKGIIRERAVILDANLLDLTVNVFAELRLKQHDEATLVALEAQVHEHPEIVECFSMSGESDYLMRIVVRCIADYEKFLKKVLLHLPGVGSINSSFALNRIKLTTNLPL